MNKIHFGYQEQEQTHYDSVLEESRNFDLVLFNDDVNTFDWVIESLIEVCDHDPIQAEQSAFIVDYKGKCTVKTGEFEVLEKMHRELSNRDLSVEIL
jgi:ATP-dependent Clp protease adaptor protein ClpS